MRLQLFEVNEKLTAGSLNKSYFVIRSLITRILLESGAQFVVTVWIISWSSINRSEKNKLMISIGKKNIFTSLGVKVPTQYNSEIEQSSLNGKGIIKRLWTGKG